MPKPKSSLLDLWYQALSSPFGIELVCSDTHAVIQKLYREREAAHDDDLKAISICQSPFGGEKIWLVRKQ